MLTRQGTQTVGVNIVMLSLQRVWKKNRVENIRGGETLVSGVFGQ